MNKQMCVGMFLLPTLLICPVAMGHLEMLNEQEKAAIIHQEWGKAKDNSSVKAHMTTMVNPVKEVSILPVEFNQAISIKVNDLLLSEILKPMVETLQYNLILGPGVEDKKMSINVHNVSIGHAFNVLLYKAGYGFKAKDKDLIILAQETRVFSIVLPPVNGQFSDVTSNESFVQSSDKDSTSANNNQQIKLGTKILVENESKGINLWGDVTSNLKVLISVSGQFSINKPAGIVIVTDVPAALDRIAQYFDDLNHRIAQQIEVDVRVVEVILNNENRFGVDWNVLANDLKTLNSLGMATNFATGNRTSGQFFTFNADGSKPGSGINANGLKIAIDALQKQGKVEIVSQPRVTMLNNQVAVIQVGSTQSFIDRTNIETTQTGTITSVSTSQVQEGVTMRLLGNIIGDQIYLSVTPVVTTIDSIRSIVTGNTTIEAPQTTTKSINTLVKLNAGETVAIGGLMTSIKEKGKDSVPVLSKLPLIGKLFEYSYSKQNKTELVIFITPRKV